MRKNIMNFLRRLVFNYFPRFLFKKLTPCETIAFQLSFPEKLSFRERFQIKFHLLFCHSCWVYNQQVMMIERGLKKFYGKVFNLPEDKLRRLEELNEKIVIRSCCNKDHK